MIRTNLITNLILLLFLLTCSDNHYRNQEPQNVDLEVQTTDENNLTSANKEERPIYVAISAMISPKEILKQYKELINYLSAKLKTEVKLKQRKSYGEVNDLLQRGKLEFAFICSGAYVEAEKKFPIHILAVPVINNEPEYYAYIIVNNKTSISSLKQLFGTYFAYTDPLSNTGYKYGLKLIKELGYDPENFFSQTIFTHGHDYSIQAVARGVVDGAAIDGLILDYSKVKDPSKVKDVRIIKKSELFDIPPIVYTDKSDEYNNRVLKLEPENVKVLYNKGAISASCGNLEQAKEIWNRIVLEFPESETSALAKQSLERL